MDNQKLWCGHGHLDLSLLCSLPGFSPPLPSLALCHPSRASFSPFFHDQVFQEFLDIFTPLPVNAKGCFLSHTSTDQLSPSSQAAISWLHITPSSKPCFCNPAKGSALRTNSGHQFPRYMVLDSPYLFSFLLSAL